MPRRRASIEAASSEPKFLGLLHPESDAVDLPRKAGNNELVLSLTEYFGGWGFLAVLEPPGPK